MGCRNHLVLKKTDFTISDLTIGVGIPSGTSTRTFQSYVYCWKTPLTPDLCHILLSARVLDNLAMFNHFHQKREGVEKKVVFDPVEALGAANLLVFNHRFLLDKDILTELEKQHTIFYTSTHWRLEWEYAFIAQRKLRDARTLSVC